VGVPRPHGSWRDMALVMICLGVICGILLKVTNKFRVPWFATFISKKAVDLSPRCATVSERVASTYPTTTNNNSLVLDERRLNMEQQMIEQNKKLDDLLHMVNMERGLNKQPVRDD
jgi:hypothetical protein